MRRPPVDTPEWFRDEAERCFRLAEKMTDQKSIESLMRYGSELLAQAERMEATLAAAVAEEASEGAQPEHARGGELNLHLSELD